MLRAYRYPGVFFIKSLTPNVSVSEVIPDRGKGLANKELEHDIRDIEPGIAHDVNTFTALLHLVKMFNYIITFFGCTSIKFSHVYNKGLVAFIVIYSLQTLPHFVGSFTLTDMH